MELFPLPLGLLPALLPSCLEFTALSIHFKDEGVYFFIKGVYFIQIVDVKPIQFRRRTISIPEQTPLIGLVGYPLTGLRRFP